MEPVRVVAGGRVRGFNHAGVNAFLSIPYAAAAVGADRYRAPQPVVPWAGERDATGHGPTPGTDTLSGPDGRGAAQLRDVG